MNHSLDCLEPALRAHAGQWSIGKRRAMARVFARWAKQLRLSARARKSSSRPVEVTGSKTGTAVDPAAEYELNSFADELRSDGAFARFSPRTASALKAEQGWAEFAPSAQPLLFAESTPGVGP